MVGDIILSKKNNGIIQWKRNFIDKLYKEKLNINRLKVQEK